MTSPSTESLPATPAISRTVWMLGLVSFFMDVSSEIIHALLPLFLTTTLGASVAIVGLIDGIAESTAAITKVFSGYVSDKIARRKPLLLAGYGLAALTKPIFALAAVPSVVFAARFADRIGKGLRGAPRDALVADVTPHEIRGKAFGIRQALDTAGAFTGPMLAIALMALFANDMRAVFWIATLPAALAVLCVLFGVEDRTPPEDQQLVRLPIRITDISKFERPFWIITGVGFVFTLARFSEAFLILKANAGGLPLMWAPLVLVVMNIVYSLGAYPAGALSDRAPAGALLLYGVILLIGADLALALSTGLGGAFFGIVLWGAHMALTQGLFAKLVADHAPANLRGSAFGVFNLVTGAAMLFASVFAGLLWTMIGPQATFFAGAGLAALAGVLVLATQRVRNKRKG